MSAAPEWGHRVRLAGGHLAHWAGRDQDGNSYLAHGDYAWTGTLRPAGDDAPACPRCVRNLPVLARSVKRALEEDIARRCPCGALTLWPRFICGECGHAAPLETQVRGGTL